MNIGHTVKRIRKERKWSQHQMAQSLGIQQTEVSAIERGAHVSDNVMRKTTVGLGIVTGPFHVVHTDNMAAKMALSFVCGCAFGILLVIL